MSKPVEGLGLSDEERFALMKFRRSVIDITKPEHDDYFLLRWLRARSWNAEAAEKMLRTSAAWRTYWETDTLDKWEPPEVLKTALPYGLSGFDNDGAPVILCPFVGFDIVGILHSVSRSDFIRIIIQRLESFLALAYRQSIDHGIAARQLILIMDMEQFAIKPFLWRPASDAIISLIKMYEANYPEILKYCFVINAPKVFSLAFSVVKPFMHAYTISKIHIFGADPAKWKPMLLKHIPADQLPVHFGGTMKDPDGNTRCIQRICQGGKVDRKFYKQKEENTSSKEQFKETVINSGNKFTLDFTCTKPGCYLRWEFRTEGHDIGFGIIKKDQSNAQEMPVIPIARIGANHLDEIGFVPIEPSTTYSVVFDNSYSVLRNKKLLYSVGLSEPLNLEEVSIAPTDD